MCTAINFTTDNHYFGRNLDLDLSYGEEVCVLPRNFPLKLRNGKTADHHFAIIGMATVEGGLPLFYDAANEHGLSAAGLDFPENAHYFEEAKDKDNICQFEFIPWILGNCKNIYEAENLLKNINITNTPFSEKFPVSPLHWIISDKNKSLVVESMADGLHIYEDPVGILTNNPPFGYQLFNLNNYRNLKTSNGENTFSSNIKLREYSQGLGTLGLPGDVSSMSRFVRASFLKENSVCEDDELSSVSQFFHILSSVEKSRGCCIAPSGKYSITVYSSCINTNKGLYYYTTYSNRRINCVDMHRTDLNSDVINRYPLILTEQINYQN